MHASESADEMIDFDKPGFWKVCVALILSGFCAFSALYCVQPILPGFATGFGGGPAPAR
ncbi:hypothetical protein [Paenirhodobacter enshiensis]|uniref:hypothetical protein n=1 Tax=Paenirhodobacter enshiensis TaxID=1105367 RepID=UPI003FA27B25